MLSELFIDGKWQMPSEPGTIDIFNPCTEEVLHRVAAGGPADVEKAVAAAKAALPGWKKVGGAVRGPAQRPRTGPARRSQGTIETGFRPAARDHAGSVLRTRLHAR